MIHVDAQPEPDNFDTDVRQKGITYLQQNAIDLTQPLPPNTTITAYWRACLDDLYTRYRGVCAYLAVHFERTTGGGSVDHFIAKSQRADLAYEWDNFRLACSIMNSRKNNFEDVLDPFDVLNGWFHLEVVSGRIFPDPALNAPDKTAVQATIDRLKLDDYGNREMRARHYQEYRDGYYTAAYLQRRSPFVFMEVRRQNLL